MVKTVTFMYVRIFPSYFITSKLYLFDYCSINNFKLLSFVFYFPNLMFTHLLASFLSYIIL